MIQRFILVYMLVSRLPMDLGIPVGEVEHASSRGQIVLSTLISRPSANARWLQPTTPSPLR